MSVNWMGMPNEGKRWRHFRDRGKRVYCFTRISNNLICITQIACVMMQERQPENNGLHPVSRLNISLECFLHYRRKTVREKLTFSI